MNLGDNAFSEPSLLHHMGPARLWTHHNLRWDGAMVWRVVAGRHRGECRAGHRQRGLPKRSASNLV